MINGPLTLQTLAFFSYLYYYFMLPVVLCRALGPRLCEHDGKAHTKASIKPQKVETSSHKFAE